MVSFFIAAPGPQPIAQFSKSYLAIVLLDVPWAYGSVDHGMTKTFMFMQWWSRDDFHLNGSLDELSH